MLNKKTPIPPIRYGRHCPQEIRVSFDTLHCAVGAYPPLDMIEIENAGSVPNVKIL
jgi:hypothetical protein